MNDPELTNCASYIEAAFEAAEADAMDLAEACVWQGCDVTEPLVFVQGDWWCFEHGSEDALPRLFSASLAACAQCGRTTSKCLADGTQICPGCRRARCAKRVTVAKPVGAYARRRKR